MKKFLILVNLALVVSGQQFTVSGGVTITATGGDGSSCIGGKVPGSSKLSLSITCKDASGAEIFIGIIKGTTNIVVGDVACQFGFNPTPDPVSIGALGAVPGNSVGYQCSVNLRATGSAGPVTGNVLATSGAASFP